MGGKLNNSYEYCVEEEAWKSFAPLGDCGVDGSGFSGECGLFETVNNFNRFPSVNYECAEATTTTTTTSTTTTTTTTTTSLAIEDGPCDEEVDVEFFGSDFSKIMY